jgi:hypothetical protein
MSSQLTDTQRWWMLQFCGGSPEGHGYYGIRRIGDEWGNCTVCSQPKWVHDAWEAERAEKVKDE